MKHQTFEKTFERFCRDDYRTALPQRVKNIIYALGYSGSTLNEELFEIMQADFMRERNAGRKSWHFFCDYLGWVEENTAHKHNGNTILVDVIDQQKEMLDYYEKEIKEWDSLPHKAGEKIPEYFSLREQCAQTLMQLLRLQYN